MNHHQLESRPSGRIQSLDVLRGISLLGIVIVNIMSFHSPYGYYNPYEWWKYEDLSAFMWIDVLVQGSFYPIFAIMFGYGIVIMQERSAIKGYPFLKIIVRRLTALLLFGIVHAFLIWYGDILITYAVVGLLLLLFLRLSGPMLLLLGIGLFLIPQLFMSVMLIIITLNDPYVLTEFTDVAALQQSETVYATGNFFDITMQRITDWATLNFSGGIVIYLFLILPMMMIGAGAAKLKWLEKAKLHWKKWLIAFFTAAILGLAMKLFPLYAGTYLSFQYIQDSIGGPLLGFAYISGVVLIMNSHRAQKLLKPIGSAGKLSITIYITQSIIFSLLFYGYGAGLYGHVSLITGTWLAIGIYVIQVIIADIWLSKFRHGPIERFWRLLTYGKQRSK